MPIVNIPEADEPVEVPADAIESGEDEDIIVKTQDEFDSLIQSRLSRKESNVRESLKSDEDFVRSAAQETLGVEFREDGKPKGSVKDEELQELRQRASKAESLEKKVSEYEETINETRETKLWNTVLEKAPSIREGAENDVKAAVKRQMQFDDDYGWVATDEDGNVRYDAGEPVGPEGVVNELSERKEFLFQSTEMKGGPDDEPGGSAAKGKTWTEAEWQEAAKQTHQMSDSEFEDWDKAKEEGRVQ